MIDIEARLDELKVLGLHRRTRLVSGPQGPHVVLDGKPVLLLCSDNCLGLADHPRAREAAADAAMRWGVGAGASRLASGTMTIHRRLEEQLAAFIGRQGALLFGSADLANTGVVAALARPGDVVFCDELGNASLLDGCRLSGAEVFVYDHGDVEHLAWGIEHAEGRGALVATESVFALQGDVAPLEAIVELAQRHGIRTLVDESHGLGALGPGGRGALAEAGLENQVDVITGTLSAALGSYGGFAACDASMTRHLVNAAGTFMFSAALPPPAVAGALAALALLRERPRRTERLAANATVLRSALRREGFGLAGSRTHILALGFGDARLTLRMCEGALQRGVFAQAVLPPAVPDRAAQLRLAVMATHQEEELARAGSALGAVARGLGVEPAAVSPAPVDLEPERVKQPALTGRRITRRRSEPAPEAPAAVDTADRRAPQRRVFDFEAPEPVRRAA